MSDYNFTDIGERLEPNDPRGVIAFAHVGQHQDAHDSTLEADNRLARWKRTATDLEVALLEHVGSLDPDDKRVVTVTNTWPAGIRQPTYTAGREVLVDRRLRTSEETPNV